MPNAFFLFVATPAGLLYTVLGDIKLGIDCDLILSNSISITITVIDRGQAQDFKIERAMVPQVCLFFIYIFSLFQINMMIL